LPRYSGSHYGKLTKGHPGKGFGHEPRARLALIVVPSPVQSVKTRIEGVLLDQRPMPLHYGSPLWVISGHMQCKRACPFYTQ
jgi:hypothetical protein